MGANFPPMFLTELAKVFDGLRPPSLSVAFLTDLKGVHGGLPVASEANLRTLAGRFDKWRCATREVVRSRLKGLADDDPLCCPISLFRTMDYGRLETAHTRALAWLLDPTREHGFGTALAAALLHRLSRGTFEGLKVERVESEFLIAGLGGKGRLDVLVEGRWRGRRRDGWVLVVEAKIDASEGEDQLEKYEKWLQSHAAGRELFRAFLTPHGSEPKTGAEEWEPLSYLELVRIFRPVYGRLRRAPGFHFLRFYLAGVLQDVCLFPRDVQADTVDPYALAWYLKAVDDSETEEDAHDAAR